MEILVSFSNNSWMCVNKTATNGLIKLSVVCVPVCAVQLIVCVFL